MKYLDYLLIISGLIALTFSFILYIYAKNVYYVMGFCICLCITAFSWAKFENRRLKRKYGDF